MKRAIGVLVTGIIVGLEMLGLSRHSSDEKDQPSGSIVRESDRILADLSKRTGVFIRRSDLLPQVAHAQQNQCGFLCDPQHEWGGTGAFSVFRVKPVYWTTPTAAPAGTPTATPRALVWNEHAAGNIPPVSIYVSWGGNVENLEIHPDSTSSGSSNIVLHINGEGCGSGVGMTGQELAAQGSPCIESVLYDIDWDEVVNGDHWDWIYFWVRDPDFSAMKAVDAGANCNTSSWPYEYVNAGPKYSMCQSFSELLTRQHGINGINVTYNVLYKDGAPATPTSGATTTPPSPVTATPCSSIPCP